MEDTKKCPYCGQEIKAIAKKCRFCGQWLDKDTNEVATKGEAVKPQVVTPVEQVTPIEEVKEDNKATDSVVTSIPSSETSSNGSKNSVVYWILGVVAAALLIGIGFLLGNNKSDTSVDQEQAAVEETDPETLIRKQVEAIYADVFSSPAAN